MQHMALRALVDPNRASDCEHSVIDGIYNDVDVDITLSKKCSYCIGIIEEKHISKTSNVTFLTNNNNLFIEHNEYCIPEAGRLLGWRMRCDGATPDRLCVWRRTETKNVLSYVGGTLLPTGSSWWSFTPHIRCRILDDNDQFPVQKGDFLGFCWDKGVPPTVFTETVDNLVAVQSDGTTSGSGQYTCTQGSVMTFEPHQGNCELLQLQAFFVADTDDH